MYFGLFLYKAYKDIKLHFYVFKYMEKFDIQK